MEHAARRCCENPFYAFHKPPGTSLICIQGDWSNVVDAKIKGRMATAMGPDSKSPYSPLYARAVGTPKPWGVTALFAEYTGTHHAARPRLDPRARTVRAAARLPPLRERTRRGGANPSGRRGILPARRATGDT